MEHIDVINKIIEAEHNAQNIANEARRHRDALPEAVEEENRKLREAYFSRADQRIALVQEQEDKIADEQLALLEVKLASELASLEAMYERRREGWALRLFEMVITL